MLVIKKVVIAAIYNSNNELLLQERWDYSKHGEEWAFFGWWIENWEGIEEAFYRESMEELDIDMKEMDCKYIWEYISYNSKSKRFVFRHIFLLKTDLLYTDFTILEWSGCKYYSVQEAKKLKFQSKPDRFLDYLMNKISENNK